MRTPLAVLSLVVLAVLAAPVPAAVADDPPVPGQPAETPEQKKLRLEKELQQARDALPDTARPALALLDQFRDREFRVWSSVRDRLVAHGPDAVPALRVGLRELDWETRAFAAACLADIADRSVAADLVDAFREETYTEARRQYVLALAELRAPTAAPALRQAAAEEDPGVRLAAVRALGRLGDPEQIEYLRTFVDDPELDIRYEARGAIAELGDAEMVAALVAEARGHVATRELQRKHAEPLEDNEVRYSQYLLGFALTRARDKQVDRMLNQVVAAEKPWSHKDFLRMGAAEGFGVRAAQGEDPQPILLSGITHRDERVRVACTHAAGFVGRAEGFLKRLRQALGDNQLDVRHNAAIALGRIGTDDAAKALQAALSDRAGEVRIGAVRALGDIRSPEGTKGLVRAARDSKYMIRVMALRLLADRITGKEVLPTLLKAVKDADYGVRMQALASLARAPEAEAVLHVVVGGLDDRDFGVRANACLSLATLPQRDVVAAEAKAVEGVLPLWLHTDHPRVKRAADEFLDAVRPAGAFEPLVDALGDKDEEVRRRASLALQKMAEVLISFDPAGSVDDRKAVQQRWREWWERVGGKFPPRGARTRMVATGDFLDVARDLKWKGLDIALLFDSTASMASLISAAKERIDEIIRELGLLLPSLRVSVYTYRDDTDDYMYYGTPLTFDTWKLTGFLQSAVHGQGRNIPEAVYQVVRNSTENLKWRKDAHKVVVYAGDAPHHPEHQTVLLEKVKEFFTKENQAVLHAIYTNTNRRSLDIDKRTKRTDDNAAGSTTFKLYKMVAEAGRGQAVLLDDESALIKEMLVLTFGEAWRADIENLLDFEL